MGPGTPPAPAVFTEVAASATMSFSTSPTGWLTFKLPATPLLAGSTYVATIVTTGIASGPPNLYVVLGADNTTQQPDGIALIYLPAATPSADWFTVSSLPMIRLNVVSPFAGISESNIEGVSVSQNMPNPTNGVSVINFELAKNAMVALNVYDVTGKIVATQNIGEQNAGSHSVNFNAANLSAGLYYYSLTVNNAKTSAMKMVVIK